MRCLAVAAAATLALAVGASVARPAVASSPRFSLSRISAGQVSFRDTVLSNSRRLQTALRAGRWGGPVAASDGEVVQLYISDSYPVDEALTRSLADFLVQLYHGPELGTVVIYTAPLDELQSICGDNAGGCYDPSGQTIIVPGEDLPGGTTKEDVLVHELGHHVARNRTNPPWTAVDWGTKRWATAIGVCARTLAKTAFPGDEDLNYYLNPGEAFAESYRRLNFEKQAWPEWVAFAPWNSDVSFYPDAAALEALRLDVVEPWVGPTTTSWRGRVAKAGRTVRRVVATPLDGTVSARLVKAPAGASISIVDPSTGGVLFGGGRRAGTTACGQHSLVLVVRATKPGAFSASYATP